MLGCEALIAMRGRWRTGAALLLVLLAFASCSGIEPYEVRNRREEGPESGVLTGSQGEFVIFRYGERPKSEEETGSGGEPEPGAEPEGEDAERALRPP